MPGLMMAARAGNRMQARQMYRTVNRMERRRGYLDGGYQSQPQYYDQGPSQAQYNAEAEQLKVISDLHRQGILTTAEYQARKQQILGTM